MGASMSIETHTMLLPGFEDIHVGLRHVQCACGCGETFWAKNIGRPKLYINSAHKAKFYRNNRKAVREAQVSPDEIFQLKEQLEALRHQLAMVEEIAGNMADNAYGDDCTIPELGNDILKAIYA